MDTYKATATRSGEWWAIAVKCGGREIWTQARRAREVADMARDAVASALDVPEDSFEVSVSFAGDVADIAREVAAKRDMAAMAQAEADQATMRAALVLLGRGLTARDTATLLGLSPGRISQLTSGRA